VAIVHLGTNTASSPAENFITVTRPTTVSAGDVLIGLVASGDQSISPPAGWTEFMDAAYGVRVHGFYKVATGSEATSYTFTGAADTAILGVVSAYSGVDQANPIDIAATILATGAATEPYATPSITGGTSGKVYYVRAAWVSAPGATPVAFSTAGAASERADLGVASGGFSAYSMAFYESTSTYTSGGTKSGLAITASGSLQEHTNIVATFALRGVTVPGPMEVLLGLPTASLDGLAQTQGPLAVDLSLPEVAIEGLGVPIDGPMEITIPPVVDFPSYVWPTGTASVTVPISMDFEGETRRLTSNVIIIEEDPRWLIIHQDDIEVVSSRRTHREFDLEAELPLPICDIIGHADISSVPAEVFGFPLQPKIHLRPHPQKPDAPITTYPVDRIIVGLAAGEATSNVDAFDAKVNTSIHPDLVTATVSTPTPKVAAAVSSQHVNTTVEAWDSRIISAALIPIVATAYNASVSATVRTDTPIMRVSDIRGGHAPSVATAYNASVMGLTVVTGVATANQPQVSLGASSGFVLAECHNAPMMPLPTVNIAATRENQVYAVNIGDGSTTSFAVTHNFNTRDVLTAVYEASSPYEEVQPTAIERTTVNTVTVTFTTPPTTNQYRVVVVLG
jgi:hypothetical protein